MNTLDENIKLSEVFADNEAVLALLHNVMDKTLGEIRTIIDENKPKDKYIIEHDEKWEELKAANKKKDIIINDFATLKNKVQDNLRGLFLSILRIIA